MEVDGFSTFTMIDDIINILHQNKAENVLVYNDIRDKDNIYIVASCLSNKHTKAITHYIIQEIKHYYAYTVEGLEEGNWILIDLGDGVMIHLFKESARQYYGVDSLWQSLVNNTLDRIKRL